MGAYNRAIDRLNEKENFHEALQLIDELRAVSETEENKVTFQKLTDLLIPLIIKEDGKNIQIKPKIIVAIHYQDIQKSPNYKSGWALRFPRITNLRDDKHISEINTLDEIEEDFKNQRAKNYKYG